MAMSRKGLVILLGVLKSCDWTEGEKEIVEIYTSEEDDDEEEEDGERKGI